MSLQIQRASERCNTASALPLRCSGRQHVPMEEYVGHMKAFVERIRAVGAEHIILITPPPVDEAARVQENQQVRGGHLQARRCLHCPQRGMLCFGLCRL